VTWTDKEKGKSLTIPAGFSNHSSHRPGTDKPLAGSASLAEDASILGDLVADSAPVETDSAPVETAEPETRKSVLPRIRILLADDHRILREGLASLLSEEPDLEVVAQAVDGVEAIELARRTQPDVVLMDVTMPRLDGVAATRRITAEMSDVVVIGLSMHEEDDMADAMRSAGAAAYLSKGGPCDALIATIRRSLA
jgi:CheY-like chemotaxis protein